MSSPRVHRGTFDWSERVAEIVVRRARVVVVRVVVSLVFV